MHWESSELEAGGDRVAGWAAERLVEAGMLADGLYLATPDSGAREAVAFWAAARVTGLALAAPGAFPWTLSTSAAGRISQELGVRGPVTTWVGGDEALEEANATAYDDLAAGLVRRALVVHLRGEVWGEPLAAPVRVLLDAEVLTAAP